MSQSSIDSLEERSNSNSSFSLVLDDSRHPSANVQPPPPPLTRHPQQHHDQEGEKYFAGVVVSSQSARIPGTIETHHPHDEPISDDEGSVVIMESGPSSSSSSSSSWASDAASLGVATAAAAGHLIINPPSMNASDLVSNVSGSLPSLSRRTTTTTLSSPPRPPALVVVVVETTDEESAIAGVTTPPPTTTSSHTRFDAHELGEAENDDADDPQQVFAPVVTVKEEDDETAAGGVPAAYHNPEVLQEGDGDHQNDIMTIAAVLEQMAHSFRYEPPGSDNANDVDETSAEDSQPTDNAAAERAQRRKSILDKPITVMIALACLTLFGIFHCFAPGTHPQSRKLLMRQAANDSNKPPHSTTSPPLNHHQQSVNLFDQVDSLPDRGVIQSSAAALTAVPDEMKDIVKEDCQAVVTLGPEAFVETPITSIPVVVASEIGTHYTAQANREESATPEPVVSEFESSKIDIKDEDKEELPKSNLQEEIEQEPASFALLSKNPSSQSQGKKLRDDPLSTDRSSFDRIRACGEWIVKALLVLLGSCVVVQVSLVGGATTTMKLKPAPQKQPKDHRHHTNAHHRRGAPPASRELSAFIDECRHRLQRTGYCCRRSDSGDRYCDYDNNTATAADKAQCYDCFTKDDLFYICQFLNVANLSNVSRRGKKVMIDELIHCYEDLLWGYTVVEIKSILQAHHRHQYVRPASGLKKSALVDLAVAAAF